MTTAKVNAIASSSAQPVLIGLSGDTVTFTEGGPAVALDAGGDATFTSSLTDFGGGRLVATLTSGGVTSEDQLTLRADDHVALNGTSVTFDGSAIATVAGGTSGTPLTVTFASGTTTGQAQAVLRALAYVNTNTAAPDTHTRNISIALTDPDGGSSAASTVSVAVAGQNDAPVLTPNTLFLTGVAENSSRVLTFADLLKACSVSDPDGDALSFKVMTIGSGSLLVDGVKAVAGSTVITTTSKLLWLPQADSTGRVDGFSFAAFDGTAESSAWGQVRAIISDVDPDLVGPLSASVKGALSSGSSITSVQVTGDTNGLSYSLVDVSIDTGKVDPNGARILKVVDAGLAVNSQIGYVYVVNADKFAGFLGTNLVVRVGVDDEDTDTDLDDILSINVTVKDANEAPTGSPSIAFTNGTEDMPYRVQATYLLYGFRDPEGLTLKVQGLKADHGTVTDNGDGTYTITPDKNFNGKLTLTYSVVDPSGKALDNQTQSINFVAINDAPAITGLNNLAGKEGQSIALTYADLTKAASLSDVDGDTVSFKVMALGSGTLTVNGAIAVAGETLISPDAQISWTPAANTTGSVEAFSLAAFDGKLTSTATVPVHVDLSDVNPTLTGPTAVVLTENSPVGTVVARLAVSGDQDGLTYGFGSAAVAKAEALNANGVSVASVGTAVISAPSQTPGTVISPDGAFALDTKTGVITVHDASKLDFEKNPSFKLTVTVDDEDADSTADSTLAVTITLADVNDAPAINGLNTVIGGNEGQSVALSYAELLKVATLSDQDSDKISFQVAAIVSGTLTVDGVAAVAGKTVISETSVVNWTPAANSTGSIEGFSLAAFDGELASAATVPVRFNLADVNPSLTGPLSVTLTENSPVGTVVARLGVSGDQDGLTYGFGSAVKAEARTLGSDEVVGSTGTAVISAPSQTPSTVISPDGAFALDTKTGVITVHDASKLDFEKNPSFQLTVTVDDEDADTTADSTVAVAITLADVNDAPVISGLNTVFAGNEGKTVALSYAELLKVATLSDQDSDKISFQVAATLSGTLTVDGVAAVAGKTLISETSVVSWTPAANSTGSVDAFSLVAFDGDLTSATSVPVRFNLADVNPSLTAPTAVLLTENSPVGTLVARLGVSGDQDGLTFGFASAAQAAAVAMNAKGVGVASVGTGEASDDEVTPSTVISPDGAFALDTKTGVITVHDASKLDFEASPTIKLTVTVDDEDADTTTDSTLAITIELIDVNEAPIIRATDTAVSGQEGQSSAVSYADLAKAVALFDTDGDAVSFKVMALGSGTLTVNGAVAVAGETFISPDSQISWTPAANTTGSVEAFSVAAFDGELMSAATVPVRIDVADVDPTLTGPLSVTLAENSPAGTVVARLAVSGDLDGLTFGFGSADEAKAETLNANGVSVASVGTGVVSAPSETSGTLISPDGAFALDTKTGVITVYDASKLNFEASPSFKLTVTVDDEDAGTAADSTLALTINLADVNEAPVIKDKETTWTGIEEQPIALSYADLQKFAQLSDPDGDTLAFKVMSLGAGTLTVDGVAAVAGQTLISKDSAVIWTPAPHAIGSMEAFSLAAFDGKLTSEAAVPVRISIIDLDPLLTGPTAASLAENSAAGTVIAQMRVTHDTDDLTYGFADATETVAGKAISADGAFAIDTLTGVITVNDASKLNFETNPSFKLAVTVDDEDVDTVADNTLAVTINLTDVNEAPVIKATGAVLKITDLGRLPSADVVTITGAKADESVGSSLSNAGDVNGDGIDDIIIGAPDTSATPGAGAAYVIYGKKGGLSSLSVANLTSADGFKISGANAGDSAGKSVSSAGDLNGDGIDDLLIGARNADKPASATAAAPAPGAAYVVYGKAGGSSDINLGALSAADGFKIIAASATSRLGYSVASAGDINGDGIDDIIVGATLAPVAATASGGAYVIYGKTEGLGTIDLAKLSASDGFSVGGRPYDNGGASVSGIGDVNGDGIDDLVVGAPGSDLNGTNSGAAFVVYGQSGGLATLNLASLTAAQGFRIIGPAAGITLGFAVSEAGDVNGDGVRDLIVGASSAEGGKGATYVVYGKTGAHEDVALASLGTQAGFKIVGAAKGDGAGYSVSGAGDVNGDGIDDLLVGTTGTDGNGADSGTTYVVFGTNGQRDTLDLATLTPDQGVALEGAGPLSMAGFSVSAAGDLNGDGIDDLIVGSPNTNDDYSGAAYVIYGRKDFGPSVPLEGTAVRLTYNDLLKVATVSDPDGDTVSFKLMTLGSGVLLVDGVAAVAGETLITQASVMTWTPPANTIGTLEAFSLVAFDGERASDDPEPVPVRIAITDVAPVLTGPAAVTLAENSAAGTVVARLAVSGDQDGLTYGFGSAAEAKAEALNANGVVVSSVGTAIGSAPSQTSGTVISPDGAFALDTKTGVITVHDASKLDFETNPTIKLTVTVDDEDADTAADSTLSLTITLDDVNEAPLISDRGLVATGLENQPITLLYDSLLRIAGLSDPDGDGVTFKVAALGAGTLTVNGTAAVAGETVITPASMVTWTPTANTTGLMQAFSLAAFDGELTSASTVPVRFNVADVNPSLSAALSVTLAENSPAGTVVARLASGGDLDGLTFGFGSAANTDDDAVAAGTVVVSAPSQTSDTVISADGAFALDTKTGVITVHDASKLDFETSPSFTLAVTVDDEDADSIADSTLALTITLANVNEAPAISGLPASALAATTGQAMALPTLTFTDPDSTVFTVTLAAVNGTLAGLVDGDAATAGLQVTGTAAEIQALLAAATFTPLIDGPAQVFVTVADNAGAATSARLAFQAVTSAGSTVEIDGAVVSTTTQTKPDGSLQQTVSVGAVEAGAGVPEAADIPLVKDADDTLLSARIPTGVGLTAVGAPAPQGTEAGLLELIAQIRQHTPEGSADQTELAEGGTGFLQGLPSDTTLVVQTLVLTAAEGMAVGAPVVIRVPEGTAPTALVVDASALPVGTLIQFENVAFAAVVGPVSLGGGSGAQMIYADDAPQTIMLGADDDELHAGGGNDTVGSADGDDRIFGEAGDDIVFGGAGRDLLHGGLGTDTARFDGNVADYEILHDRAITVVRSRTDATDVDVLVNVETIAFADGTVALALPESVGWIAALYASVLGRQGDLAGIQHYAGLAERGVSAGDIALAFLTSPEAIAAGTGAAASDMTVERLYSTLFGRAPDAEGLAYHKAQLAAGATLAEVAAHFVLSPEMQGHLPAADALDFVVGAVSAGIVTGTTGADTLQGGTLDDTLISNGGADLIDGRTGNDTAVFSGNRADYAVSSDTLTFTVRSLTEASNVATLANVEHVQFADMTIDLTANSDLQWIGALYTQVLGRQGEESGLVAHLADYQAGASKGEIALSFLLSPEAMAAGHGAQDAEHLTADTVYQALLGHAPTQADHAAYGALETDLIGLADALLGSAEMQGHYARQTEQDFFI